MNAPRKLVTAKLIVTDPTRNSQIEIDYFVCCHCQVSLPVAKSGGYCGPCNRLFCAKRECVVGCNSVLRQFDAILKGV